ncbi:MAG: carboxymuconolactone decarboxylase family protein [Candidatus Deferrimicrobiaceae bacterium]
MELDEKTKELIAVGATITANNQSSLEYHLKIALEEGSDAEEIAEAIEMGKQVRKGAADKMDEFSAGSKDCGFAPMGWIKSACCG